MNLHQNLSATLLWIVIAVNIVLVMGNLYLRHEQHEAVAPGIGVSISSAALVDQAGRLIEVHPGDGTPCLLVRFASSTCGFCTAEVSQHWFQLRNAASKWGCQVVSLAAHGTAFAREDGADFVHNAVYVSMPLAAAVRFRYTPTTVLFDRKLRIVWSHVGLVGASDVSEAVATLR